MEVLARTACELYQVSASKCTQHVVFTARPVLDEVAKTMTRAGSVALEVRPPVGCVDTELTRCGSGSV